MARISTHRLEELVREAEVLSSIRADIPNAWRILEHEIGRARAAIVQSMEPTQADSTLTLPSSELSSTSEPLSHVTASTTDRLVATPTLSIPTASSAASATADVHNEVLSTSGVATAFLGPPVPVSAPPSSTPTLSTAPPNPAAVAAAVAVFADLSHPPPTASRHPIRKRVKLRVPADQFPDYNFVGRLLGPRGATLKLLERDTACRIMIRGKGSIRKDKEAEVRGKAGWEHVFHEPLHVVIEVVDAADETTAARTLARAKERVELLLVPVPEERDSLKRAQLRDLAILNGTHRSVSDPIVPPPQLHHQLSLNPSRSPPPPTPLGASPPPLRRTHSAIAKPTPSLYHPSAEPYMFEQPAPFGRLSSPPPLSSSGLVHRNGGGGPSQSQAQLPSVAPFSGGNGFSGNPSLSADSFLSDLSKLRIPTLNFDSLNEPNGLSSPLPLPLASPTIVDPDIYPYPPTPGLVSVEPGSLGAFGSPMWSTHSGTAGGGSNGLVGNGLTPSLTIGGPLPPRSPPPGGLPPRSPPPPGVKDHGAVSSSSTSFLMGRGMDGQGSRFGGRDLQQRDTAFDHGFGPHVSSPQFRDDDLSALGLNQAHRGAARVASPVGSPPPSSPPPSLMLQNGQHKLDVGGVGQVPGSGQGAAQAFGSADSIMLSSFFQQQANTDLQNEHVSLRFHQSHLQGNSQPLCSPPPPSTTGTQ